MKTIFLTILMVYATFGACCQNHLSMLYSSAGMEYGKANAVDHDTNYINGALFQNTINVDHNGNLWFTGRLSGTNTVNFDPNGGTANVSNSALYLASFDPAGNLRFAEGFNSGAGDGGHRVAFDNQNNVYMAGWMNGTVNFGNGINRTAYSPTADVFLAKFDNNGSCQWAFNFGCIGSAANNICAGLLVDQENNPIITGQLYGTNADVDPGNGVLSLSSFGNNDCFIIKYTCAGMLWVDDPIYNGISKTWKGPINTDWNESGNWIPGGAPVDTDNFHIPSESILMSVINNPAANCNNLVIDNNAVLTVPLGMVLTIYGNFILKSE